MRRQFSIFLLWSVVSTAAVAQGDLRPGYVITPENDTIRGEIEYRATSRNYQSCLFTQQGKILEYNPTQIKGYGFFNDRFYMNGIVEDAFVEVLVSGELSLYRYGDAFFMEKGGTELHRFEAIKRETTIDGKPDVAKDVRWKGVVSYLTNDCLHDQNRIARLRINEIQLTKFVVDYNECRKTPFHAYKADKPWTKFDFGVVLGVHMSGLNVKGPSWYSYLKKRYDSTDPFAGAVVVISSPRVSDRLAFQTGIEFTKSEYSSFVHRKVVPRRNEKTFISLTAIAVPLTLRYTIPLKKYSVQINGGIKTDFYFNAEASSSKEVLWESWIETEKSEAFGIRNVNLGYLGNLAVLRSFGKVNAGIGVRYAQTGGVNTEKVLRVTKETVSTYLLFQIR